MLYHSNLFSMGAYTYQVVLTQLWQLLELRTNRIKIILACKHSHWPFWCYLEQLTTINPWLKTPLYNTLPCFYDSLPKTKQTSYNHCYFPGKVPLLSWEASYYEGVQVKAWHVRLSLKLPARKHSLVTKARGPVLLHIWTQPNVNVSATKACPIRFTTCLLILMTFLCLLSCD